MENAILRKETSPIWKQVLTLSALSLVTVVLWAVLSSISATQDIWLGVNIVFIVFSFYLFGYRYARLFNSRFSTGVAIMLGIIVWALWFGVYGGIGLAFS
jgi:hypothetical protein